MKKMNIILASASPRRKELLNQIGIFPQILPCDLEEVITSNLPEQVVEELSAQKAAHIWKLLREPKTPDESGEDYREDCREDYRKDCEGDRTADYIVLGADTVVSVDGVILGKPATVKEAEDMIRMLQGKNHQVYTGVTLISAGGQITFSEKTEVFVWPMTEEEIKTYAAGDEPMDKAGAYGIQGYFAAFIEKIEGSYANVMGLPVSRVYHELTKIAEGGND